VIGERTRLEIVGYVGGHADSSVVGRYFSRTRDVAGIGKLRNAMRLRPRLDLGCKTTKSEPTKRPEGAP
jgi:hypothetical protein